MFKKTPVLKYESSIEAYQDSIVPSKKVVPDWYKKIPRWQNGMKPTVKQCMPFLESLTIGYLITLPYDVFVKNDNGALQLSWPDFVKNHPVLRNNVADIRLVPAGHYAAEFEWDYNVAYTLPKGYSAIFTHPFNRNDLPFTTITGVIDGGIVMHPHGNPGFYIKEGFEGLIPQGTPIAQLIPFRQENWKSKKTPGLVEIAESQSMGKGLVFSGWYKKTFWVHKKYE